MASLPGTERVRVPEATKKNWGKGQTALSLTLQKEVPPSHPSRIVRVNTIYDASSSSGSSQGSLRKRVRNNLAVTGSPLFALFFVSSDTHK